MKYCLTFFIFCCLSFLLAISQSLPQSTTPQSSATTGTAVINARIVVPEQNPQVVAKPSVILLISEQNIEGPQHAWWASEIDLSTTETRIASMLLGQGFTIIEPNALKPVINQKPAFRVLGISEQDSVKLGNLAKADYVVIGKAVASAGPNVQSSNMRSCFANITAKVIRVKDGKAISFLDAQGASAHLDVVTGGNEALSKAAINLTQKLITLLNYEGGK